MKKHSKYNSVKKNMSSIQVLKTLKVLLEGDYTMAELIQKLNENEPEAIFNNSVISKYINTCRSCGIIIPKINGKYFVTGIPFGLNFTDSEADLLEYLRSCAKSSLSARANDNFEKTVQKLYKYSNKTLVPIENKTINIAEYIFDRAIQTQRKIKLTLKTKNSLICIPINIEEKDGKLYFHVIHDEKE